MSDYKPDAVGYWIYKDPGATLDYPMDWSLWLQIDEVIVSSVWEVPAGLEIESQQTSDSGTIVWLSGGINGQTYVVTNRITTDIGRIEERSFRIKIKQR